jgi:hypothetical protein
MLAGLPSHHPAGPQHTVRDHARSSADLACITPPGCDGSRRGLDFKLLWWLLDRPARDAVLAGVLEETAARLLHAAGVAVTAVDIEPAGEDVPELRSGAAAAWVELATAAGTRHVTVSVCAPGRFPCSP